MQIWPVVKGIATWVPFAYDAHRGETGGTGSARYCYAVWMRHLVLARQAGISRPFRSVAEIGPGDSLGIGLTAMLCGADRLQTLDVVRYAGTDRNEAVLRELAELLRARATIPDDIEFPGIFPKLADYAFPDELLQKEELRRALDPHRVERIANALRGEASDVAVDYRVPWDARATMPSERVDMLYSQAVLEHVEDAVGTWTAMANWVAPGGVISHVIDLRSHWLTPHWDGHLQYSAFWWRLVKGRRPYLLNRHSPAEHQRLMALNGFRLVTSSRAVLTPTLQPHDLAPEFRGWSDDDRCTAGIHVIGVREQ